MNPVKIKTFTQNGCRLISKTKKSFGAEDLPFNIKSAITSKVETDFGKGLTTITTYLDFSEKPVKRIIKEVRANSVKTTVFSYLGSLNEKRASLIETFLNSKKISTVISSEVLTKKGGKPFLTRHKLTMVPNSNKSRKENQIIEELSTNNYRKYIETTATRDKDGTLTNKNLKTNTLYKRKLKSLNYLYFLNYSIKDFISSIMPYSKKLQNVDKDIKIQYKKLHKKVAGNSRNYGSYGRLRFDIAKIYDKLQAVTSVNHELRHQYQTDMINKLLNDEISRVSQPFKYKYAKKYLNSYKNYTPVEKDEQKYHANFLEVDAKKAASEAGRIYFWENEFLNNIFSKSRKMFSKDYDYYSDLKNIQQTDLRY